MLSSLHTVIHQMTNAWICFVNIKIFTFPFQWFYILLVLYSFFWIVLFTRSHLAFFAALLMLHCLLRFFPHLNVNYKPASPLLINKYCTLLSHPFTSNATLTITTCPHFISRDKENPRTKTPKSAM